MIRQQTLKLLVLCCCLTMPRISVGQTHTQSITLQPGWNAVWLEVQPEDNRSSSVFSNLPIASVWTRLERLSSVEFIQSPSEAAFNEAGWQRWFPADREESFLNTLFAVQANRAYLLKCTNTTPMNWSLTGRPSLRQPEWVPDSYNLRGLPVDPSAPPTFLNFFRYSPAHYNSASGQLQKIYRLDSASGQWQSVSPTDPVRSGVAYWTFTDGASDYLAPLNADVGLGDGLDFGEELTELNLNLENLTASPVNALITDSAGGTSLLSYYSFDPELGGQWFPLPSPLPEALGSGGQSTVRLAVRRQDMTSGNYESALEVRDGAGTRLLVPVSAQNPATVGAPAGQVSSAAGSADEALKHVGLWIGTATINAVSEAHSANSTNPTPTKSEMNLRLLLHVDSTGQTRLLKEVIQMTADGTYTNDARGVPVQATPPRVVLVTDDRLIGQFQPIAVRDGQLVGRRFSSATFDFDGGQDNTLLMTGIFGGNNALTGSITIGPNFPTNPFRDKYHPDHDNLDATFQNPKTEAYPVTRNFELEFSDTGPSNEPDYGYNTIGGLYREVLTGLHKHDLFLQGDFTLRRIATTGMLNQ